VKIRNICNAELNLKPRSLLQQTSTNQVILVISDQKAYYMMINYRRREFIWSCAYCFVSLSRNSHTV